LSTQVHENVAALPIVSLDDVARRTVLGKRSATMLAAGGRFGVIWLPVYALLTSRVPTLGQALLIATALSTIWFVALRSAFGAARLTLLSLGPTVAAAIGTLTGFVAVSAAGLWTGFHLSPLVELEMAGAILLFSAIWESVVHRSIAGRRSVLVVSGEENSTDLVAELRRDGPFELVGLVEDEYLEVLPLLIERTRPDIIVLGTGDNRPEAFEYLLDTAGYGFKVVGVPEFYEHAFGRVPVETLTPAWFMNVLHLYRRPYGRFAKRAFDVAVATTGLLLTGWLFPILWLLVKRTPGPAIFRQVRLGEGGERFTIYKFRSMRQDAEADGRAVWASERDPRITALGRIMRKTRLDELPQLWNVLHGDMSIVGPRPERPEFLDELRDTVPFWTRRHLVKPGITGWAQVRRGYTADAEGTADKLSYDLWYLRHRSLVLDLAICVKTFSTLVSGSGAR